MDEVEYTGKYEDYYALDTEGIKDEYKCGICLDIMSECIEIKRCGHFFCKKCIHFHKENVCVGNNKWCPICKQQFFSFQLQESVGFQRMIDDVKVKCPNCVWKGDFGQYKIHISERICENLIVSCINCEKEVVNKDVKMHISSECDYRIIKCEKCEERIRYREMETHNQHECSENVTTCPNETCRYRGKRKTMDLHRKHCIHELVNCPLRFTGCLERVERCKVDHHRKNNNKRHLDLAINVIRHKNTQLATLKNQLNQLNIANTTYSKLFHSM